MEFNKEVLKEGLKNVVKETQKVTDKVSEKTKSVMNKSKDKMIENFDANGDGMVDIEDIIILGLRTPGIKISREEFLRKELSKKFDKDMVDNAVLKNPASAGIKVEEIDEIADVIIQNERTCVSGISAALGTPGGAAMALTIPADIIQYYAYMLRTIQELMYLYGFPEIDVEEKNQAFESETMNILILCFGVMYDVSGSSNAIKAMAKGYARGVNKKILANSLTKGTMYPIISNIVKWFGVKFSRSLAAGVVKKSIPLVGGAISGGITYAAFKPCCDKLKETLQDTMLSNPIHKETKEENAIFDSIINFIDKL